MADHAQILCLGGTFNPIHYGHLISAQAAGRALGCESVRLIPCAISPLKPMSADLASPQDRLEMCRLAAAQQPGFVVDDRELRRGAPSYTIDTVRELKDEFSAEIIWLIGMDQVASLPQWHCIDALMAEARLVVMTRPGCIGTWAGPLVTVPAVEISATEIRRRVAAGVSIDLLTPPAVVEYIRRRQLWPGKAGSAQGELS